ASAYSGLSDASSVLAIWGYDAPREGFSRAKAAAQRALQLDSTLAEAHTSLGIISLYYDWNWPAAEQELARAIALDPQYAAAHLQANRCGEAIAAARLIPASLPDPEGAVRGYAYARCGNRGEAVRVLGELKAQVRRGYVIPAKVALLYAALGDADSTFAWLERGYEGRDAYMTFLKVEPLYDAVRDDPRFARLVKRVGLEP